MGNQIDYAMRVYDPRVGRFLSLDPLAQRYPFYAPYRFSGNNPIKFIDVDGMEPGVSGGIQSDAPVLNPKYSGGTIRTPSKEVDPVTKFGIGIFRILGGLVGIPTEAPGAMHYRDRIPKDRFPQEFPMLANNNIAKDLVLPILTTPFQLAADLKKDPTNSEFVDNPRANFLEYVTDALKAGGTITVRGGMSNSFFNSIANGKAKGLENYEVLSKKTNVDNPGFKTTDGGPVKSQIDEIILKKKGQ